jgi:hypothetical protein
VPSFQPTAGNEVRVVLQGLRPVVHEVLIDVVGVDERRGPEHGEQALGQCFDEGLRMAVLREPLHEWHLGRFPAREDARRLIVERGEFGMAKDGRFNLGKGELEAQ